MTSVDSGVETGNDSNDSSTVQHENQQQHHVAADHITTNSVTAVATTNSIEKDDINWPAQIGFNWVTSCLPLPLPLQTFPLTPELCLDNYNFHEDRRSSPEADLLWSNNRLLSVAICNSEMAKSPEICGTNRTDTELLVKYKTDYRAKIKSRIYRKSMFAWRTWQTQHFGRKMRVAAATNNTMWMQRLLAFGISPNNHDYHGRTPLHHAACRGYTEMVRLLLENGADPNQRDCIGNTPLHLAAVTSKISVVTLLLTAGTDVLSLDQHGYNPLQLAQTKLRMLQNCNNEDMIKVKEEMHNIVNMLLAYLQKQRNMREQVETLSNFCSRLSLSSTSDQVQDDVKDLLANINALSITG